MLSTITVLCTLFYAAAAQWGYSVDEMEVFDLADEFKGNFYEFLELSQSASTSEVRRAYRRLSLTMHPDKNKTEGAEENFRILAAIYEVLKNKEKREIYDNVLANGIPSAYLYVPKTLRKMTLTEVSAIIALVVTLGHYLFLLGSYAEKRLVYEENLSRKRKKKLKAKRKDEEEEIDSVADETLQRPGLKDFLPVAILRGVYSLAKSAPGYIEQRRRDAIAMKDEECRRRKEEQRAEEERKKMQAHREEQKMMRKQRVKKKKEEMLQYVETSVKEAGNFYSPFESGGTIEELEDMYGSSDEGEKNLTKKKNWTVEDESSLIKLMVKYPAGSSQRWHSVADEMGKDVSDVIKRAKKLKGNIGSENTISRQRVRGSNKVAVDAFSQMETVRNLAPDSDCIHSSADAISGISSDPAEQWDSSLQKLLEMALRQFPKGTPARWEKIAKCVPSKSKEDCIARYKQVVEMVQRKQRK